MNPPPTGTIGRLLSLDVLRGVDMTMIMGAEGLAYGLASLWPLPFFEGVARQMTHVAWDGFALLDLVFPLFLFIAGISFPFSIARQRAKGITPGRIHLTLLRRGLTLVVLGMVYNGLLQGSFDELRCFSVLGRIGLAWMLAAFAFIHLDCRARLLTCAGILVGYGLLSLYVAAPDAPVGVDPLSAEGCLAGYVDRHFGIGQLHRPLYDPEGWLGLIPATATALFGMNAGEIVRSTRTVLTPTRKALMLVAAGLILTATGLIWSHWLPLNKNLWSSSFTCLTAGLSFLLFALFFYIIDVRGIRRGTLFFQVIGLNSITIYLAQQFIDFGFTTRALCGGIIGVLPENAQTAAFWFAYLLLCWCFLYVLYRQHIFLKV